MKWVYNGFPWSEAPVGKRGIAVIASYEKAIRQLNDPPIRRVIIWVAAWTAAAYVVLGFLLFSAVAGFDPSASFAWIGIEWLRAALIWIVATIAGILGAFVFFALFWLLFVVIVQTVSSFYLEAVIRAVEARHYPDLPPARPQPVGEALFTTLQFFAFMIVLNLLALPFYFIPLLGVGLFYLINGYLIGREYYELIALRRLDARTARTLRRTQRGKVLGAGMITTVMFSIPVLNLVAPIVAAAAMVHMFEAMPGRHAAIVPNQAPPDDELLEPDHEPLEE